MAILIKTQSYTSSSANNKGFQQAAQIVPSIDAIDFGNGVTMTLNACLSFLNNKGLINWNERKNILKMSIELQYSEILKFEDHFLDLAV